MRVRSILGPVLRVIAGLGGILMIGVVGVRWVNDARDVGGTLRWVDEHPGWVLAAGFAFTLIVLMPKRSWDALLPKARERKAGIRRKCKQLSGLKQHAIKMLEELPSKKPVALGQRLQQLYEGHMHTVQVNIGNGIQNARNLGAFEQYDDLLTILDGVENETHGWRSSNKAIDRFQGLWFWLRPTAGEHSERGDYREYTIQRYIEIIDDKINELGD